MGRFLVGLLVVLSVVPAVFLARFWANAGQRRAVNEGTLGLVDPTPDAERTLARWDSRGRRLRTVGILAGLAGAAVVAVLQGEESVFLWVPLVALGALLGVLLGEALRPTPQWTMETDRGRRRMDDAIAPSLVWSMRAAAGLALVAAAGGAISSSRSSAGSPVLALTCPAGGASTGPWPGAEFAIPLAALVAASWIAAEVCLVRVVRRRGPADGDNVPVDDALRMSSAHVAVGAGTVLSLAALGGLCLFMGIVAADATCMSSDVLVFGLLGIGLAAVLAFLLVLVFLLRWLRPLRGLHQAIPS